MTGERYTWVLRSAGQNAREYRHQPPVLAEGFDEIFEVTIVDTRFVVSPM